jgi:protein-L-isoaspartate(D-aspartate) O-methyltransferase
MIDYATARANMVENQLRPSRIDDPGVQQAMGEIPRELFVPRALRGCAYGDEDLALGQGRFLIEPLALGKLLQASEPRSSDVALVVGDTTGYVAAVLSRLAGTVFLLVPPGQPGEPIEALLGEQGCDNVVLQQGRADLGHPEQAPFDLILLVGSVTAVPPALLEQLGEGGRLAAVVEHGRSGKVTIARKINGAIGSITPFDAQVSRLAGLPAEMGFQF